MDSRINTKIIGYINEIEDLNTRLRASVMAGDAATQHDLILRLAAVFDELKAYNIKITDSK